MASDQTLRAVITVLDRTAEPLHAINARFAAMSAPLRRIGERISEIAEETGLKHIGERAGEALEHVKRLGEGVGELLGPLAALGGVASLAGLAEIAKSTAEYGETMRLAAISTGLSTEQLAGWQYAAKLANIDADQMTKGLQYLNRNISEAAMGRVKPVAQLFAAMGLHNAPGHLVSTQQALHAVAAEVQHLVASGNIQTATDLVGQLFGQRSGMALLPIFKEGPAAIDAALADAAKHGLAISDEQAEAGSRFMDSFKGMEASVDGLRLAIGERLFPALTPVITRMTDWIDANRDWIATGISGAIAELGDALHRVDWAGILGAFKDIAGWGEWVVSHILGVRGAILLVASVSLAPAILAFGQLGSAVAMTALKFGLLPAAEFIGSLASMIPMISGAKDAMAALNLVLDANPLGAVVLGATLLAGAAYEIYEHWDMVSAGLKKVWAVITSVFDAGWDKIKPIIDAFRGSVGWLTSHLPGFSSPVVDTVPGQTYDASAGVPVPGARRPLTERSGGGPAGAAAGAAPKSESKVTVDFKNLPQGAETQVETRGNPDLDMNVGYAMQF